MDTEMKFCKDCKWSRPLPEPPLGARISDKDDLLCGYPALCHPATGVAFRSCCHIRFNGMSNEKLKMPVDCDFDAKLFEPKTK